MTEAEFWKEYTRCPKCKGYAEQGNRCYGCKFRTPYPKEHEFDLFEPTEDCIRAMQREVRG